MTWSEILGGSEPATLHGGERLSETCSIHIRRVLGGHCSLLTLKCIPFWRETQQPFVSVTENALFFRPGSKEVQETSSSETAEAI